MKLDRYARHYDELLTKQRVTATALAARMKSRFVRSTAMWTSLIRLAFRLLPIPVRMAALN